jgi:hypothetical protein
MLIFMTKVLRIISNRQMSQERNIKWLNDRRIVYRRDPILMYLLLKPNNINTTLMVRINVITCLIARLK